ncbi:glycosyltransferase family 2 protein, partial [Bacteroides acidifaciens]
VKDEEDIIESNIKFHMSLGIDGILVTDNGSTDSTMEILKKSLE